MLCKEILQDAKSIDVKIPGCIGSFLPKAHVISLASFRHGVRHRIGQEVKIDPGSRGQIPKGSQLWDIHSQRGYKKWPIVHQEDARRRR